MEPAVREREDQVREHRGRDEPTASPIVNGSDRFALMSVPAKSANPAPTMSAPVHRSRRRDEATRPAVMNERPAKIVKPASTGFSPRSWPRSTAAAPSTAHAAAAAPIADDDRVLAELGAGGCDRRGQQGARRAVPLRLMRHPFTLQVERVGLATLPCSHGRHDPPMYRRLLIVDDNSAFRAAARQLLERGGFVVVAEADSGAGAVQEAGAPPRFGARRRSATGLRRLRGRREALPPRPGSPGHPDIEPRRIRFRGADGGQPRARLHPEGRPLRSRDRSAARFIRLIRPLRRRSRLSATLRSVDVQHHDQKPGEEARIRVVLADDSVLLREGIASLLERKGFEIVGQSGTAEDLLLKVRSYSPDIAIVDIKMPPTHTDEGLRAAKEIREKHPGTAVLVLSQYVEEGYALELLQDSAEGVGYLLKDRVYDLADFVAAVKRVAGGGSALDPNVVSQLLGRSRRDDPLDELTAREREVLELMAEGLSNSAIAARVFLTDRGVEKHVTSIFQKLRLPVAADTHRRVLAVVAFLQS